MIGAALEVHNGWWVKSPAYMRLDPSEKGAASYFLGIAQAQLACAEVLNVPSLVHLDAVLAALGTPARSRRPDFLAINPVDGTLSVAAEAKGRSGAFAPKALATAKTQAQSLPTIIDTASTLAVASLSFFEPRDIYDRPHIWQCRLQDPPRVDLLDDLRISRLTLLALHYMPIAAATRTTEQDGTGTFIRATLPEMDAWLWVPTAIVEATSSAPGQVR